MNNPLRFLFLASATVLLFGLSGNVQAQQVPQAPNMGFFVTSTSLGKGGDLGGLAGAGAPCQRLAATAGAGHQDSRPRRPASGSPPATARTPPRGAVERAAP